MLLQSQSLILINHSEGNGIRMPRKAVVFPTQSESGNTTHSRLEATAFQCELNRNPPSQTTQFLPICPKPCAPLQALSAVITSLQRGKQLKDQGSMGFTSTIDGGNTADRKTRTLSKDTPDAGRWWLHSWKMKCGTVRGT